MRKVIIIVLLFIMVVSGVTFAVLYKIGDKIVDEMFTLDLPDLGGQSSNEQLNSGSNGGNSPSTTQSPSGNSGKGGHDSKNSDLASQKSDEPEVTYDDIKEIKDKVTMTDKVAIAAMVMKKLSASEISELKSLAAGGITKEEKKKVKDMVYSKFSEDEIGKLKELYNKYKN